MYFIRTLEVTTPEPMTIHIVPIEAVFILRISRNILAVMMRKA